MYNYFFGRKIFLLLFVSVLIGTTGCQQSVSSEKDISKLEKAYQEALLAENVNFQSDEFTETVLALTKAYESFAKAQPENEKATEYRFKSADLHASHLNNPSKALEILSTIVKQGNDQAGTALFRMGYIYHNTLGDLPKAESTYQQFLDEYPDHELAEAARFEIKHLGISADKIFEVIQDSTKAEPSL